MSEHIEINPSLTIPESELAFSATRSGGPGGQNVNKVSTRIVLRFDVAHSPSLSDEQRSLVMRKLHSRITKSGELLIVAQEHRTQLANRRAAIERFAEILRDALKVQPRRKRKRISVAAKERRLSEKRIRSSRKRERRLRGEET